MAPKVTVIPATIARFTSVPTASITKRRVAGYARVSTDHDDQFTSYQAQIDYYSNYIKERSDWQFVEVYTDEGITGTSIKHREGFKRMVADALDGKIDLIVTKSVSRFARNTVDSLTTIRKLKEKGVEIFFEKENIWTFDGKGELMLTIMASLAQEESRSISENCTWGQRKRFADGKVTVPFAHFLGYDRGPNGELVVNQEQAAIVRRIFSRYLQGATFRGIAHELTNDGVPTPSGSKKWSEQTVRSILSNEKYKGDALLQKTYVSDFLTKKMKVNRGEIPQYYVEGNHEAIIPPETFDFVQEEIVRRRSRTGGLKITSVFSAKIRCGECGGFYGPKTWHSNSKYRSRVWRCNSKYESGSGCSTPHLTEDKIRAAFCFAVGKLLGRKSRILDDCREASAVLFCTKALEKEQEDLALEVQILAEKARKLIERNASCALDQEEYRKQYDEAVMKYEVANAKLEKRTKPLCPVPEMVTGNRPADGGNLIIEAEDHDEFIRRESKAKAYIKRLIGSEEFINGKKRWCLWLVGVSPAELRSMPLVLKRVEACRQARLGGAPDRQKLADTPHLFRETNDPKTYVVVPKVSSENRFYVPMSFEDQSVIPTDLLFIIPGASLYHFGVLTSVVHMAWMRAVCGRLKSDYRYSKDIVYNNFPWPEADENQCEAIARTAQGILDARALYPDCSLADLYDTAAMPQELRAAHHANDRAVLQAYGFAPNMAEADIVARLMERYVALAGA